MIWFFLAGFISGAVGIVMLADRWLRKHTGMIYMPEEDEKDEAGHTDENGAGDPEEQDVSEQD